MKTIDIKEASRPLSEYVREATDEAIIVTEEGKPTVAVFSLENADWETISLSLNPQFIALIERSRTRHKKEGGISSEEMRRRLGLAKQPSSAASAKGKRKR